MTILQLVRETQIKTTPLQSHASSHEEKRKARYLWFFEVTLKQTIWQFHVLFLNQKNVSGKKIKLSF